MAERRMFTKKVTDDDNFMRLSASAQALYLHLTMSADDDGFCSQVSISMFKAHASVQDLEALLQNRYIYQFENGVIVIKDWRMANALRKDRYNPTIFQEELSKLSLNDSGQYERLPNGCQMVANCLPQDRLDKDRLDKDNNKTYYVQSEIERGSDFEQIFETVWKLYPVKRGKGQVSKTKKKVLAGIGVEELTRCIERYMNYIHREHKEKYMMNGSTFFNSGYVDYLDKNYEDAKSKKKVAAEKIVEPELSDEEWAKMIEGMD